MPTPLPAADYGDSLLPPATFVSRFPNLHRSIHALRWKLKDRAINGLMDYGAVVEVWPTGRGTGRRDSQPRLYIDVPKFFAWMQAGGARAPSPNLTTKEKAAAR
jgi:hypothetical protein